jgi:hypothetical protein
MDKNKMSSIHGITPGGILHIPTLKNVISQHLLQITTNAQREGNMPHARLPLPIA